jgi:LysM repeat protein
MLEPTMGTPNAAAGTFKPAASAPSIGGAGNNLNTNQFKPMSGALNTVRGAAAGGILGATRGAMGGPIGMVAGAGLGAAASTPAGRTAIGNVGNMAGGAARGARSGASSGMKSFGPLGGIIGGEAGAIRGAMNTPAARNVVSSAESGAKRGFGIAGPLGGLVGGGIGAIGGLFHNRASSAPATGSPAAPKASNQYTIQKGDNLSSIASKNNTTLSAIRAANPEFASNPKYKNGNMIWSGGKVNLPGASSTTAAAPQLNTNMLQKAQVSPVPNRASQGSIANLPFKGTTPAKPQPIPNATIGNKGIAQPL